MIGQTSVGKPVFRASNGRLARQKKKFCPSYPVDLDQFRIGGLPESATSLSR